MFTKPEDLSDAQVVDALRDGWELGVHAIEYAPVGFGSHHWLVTANGDRWFVTIDDLDVKRRHPAEAADDVLARLTAALSTAYALHESGLDFVVAPLPTGTGAILHTVGDRFAAALYPYVNGRSYDHGSYSTRVQRLAVIDLIAALHDATELARPTALVDDLTIDRRDELVDGLDDLDSPWTHGPYSQPARELLSRHADAVRHVLEHYVRLAATFADQPDRLALTHGEPHRGNTITTPDGVVLIDWDTTLIAAPERDLWALADEDPATIDDYAARTGVQPRADALELYRLRWDLTEIAIYVGDFRRPHRESADTRVAWSGLTHHLDPIRWRAIR